MGILTMIRGSTYGDGTAKLEIAIQGGAALASAYTGADSWSDASHPHTTRHWRRHAAAGEDAVLFRGCGERAGQRHARGGP